MVYEIIPIYLGRISSPIYRKRGPFFIAHDYPPSDPQLPELLSFPGLKAPAATAPAAAVVSSHGDQGVEKQ